MAIRRAERRNGGIPSRPDRARRRLVALLAAAPAAAAMARAAGALAFAGPAPSPRSAPARPIVARGRRDGLLGADGTIDRTVLDAVLGPTVARAASEPTPVAAMRRLFRPTDVVGIKVNALAAGGPAPTPALVGRLCDWLQEAGVPARSIVVFDRTDRELAAAGFAINRGPGGVRCFGTNQDYDWTPREWGPGASCFARFLVNDVTALINVGALKDHDLAGVSVGLKNWYGVIHNPNKHHDDGCQPYIPHLAAYPLVADRLRLTVIDGIRAQCHGGPARSPRWMWPWQGVMASTDPVAVDAVGWSILEARRRVVGLGTLAEAKREPRYIAAAQAIGLGVADMQAITVEET
jgi:uncharacterized protein (DUF362 family)